MSRRPTVLVIGYGNPARRDDGLGPALAEAVRELRLPGVDVDADYQLTVEDAAAAAEHDVVVFADAAQAGPEPFSFRRVEPVGGLGFSSHGCEPAGVMALARDLFGARAKGYILGIRGYDFGQFREGLTERAESNLAAARDFLRQVLAAGGFEEAARRGEAGPAAGTKEERPCKTRNT
jgi:hydrogenase maturation protease